MDLASSYMELGVRLYKENCGADAYELFRGSTQALLNFFGSHVMELDPLSYYVLVEQILASQSDEKDPLLNLSRDSLMSLFSKSPSGKPSRRVSFEEVPYIYPNVFSFSSVRDHAVIHQYDVATCIGLYNMALCLHRGLVPSTRKSLERALMLYNVAGTLLWERLGSIHIRQNKKTSKLYMAILNNAGYLLHELGLFDWTRLFFVRLKEFLISLGPSANRDEQKERDEFQLNVILFHGNLTTASAA